MQALSAGVTGATCALWPFRVVLADLVDVVRHVLRLNVQPPFKRYYSFARVSHGVRPHGIGNVPKNVASHSSEAHDQSQGFRRTLVEVAERANPLERVVSGYNRPRFNDELTAHHVRFGFAVREVQDNFVDAPTVVCRAIKPHLSRAMPQPF